MQMSILPVNASGLTHPLASHYRNGLKPLAGLAAMRRLFGEDDVLIVDWDAAEGLPSHAPGVVYPNMEAMHVHPTILSEEDRKKAFRNLAKAWDCCACHYPLDYIVEQDWSMVLTRDLVTFLPRKTGRQIPFIPSHHQEAFRRLTGDAIFSMEAGCCILPFVPLHEGRGSNHEDISGRNRQAGHLNAILSLLGSSNNKIEVHAAVNPVS
jgi:hypothetical protein